MIQRSMNRYEQAEDSLVREANRIGKIKTIYENEMVQYTNHQSTDEVRKVDPNYDPASSINNGFSEKEIEAIRKYLKNPPNLGLQESLQEMGPVDYALEFENYRKVLGGNSELVPDVEAAGYITKAIFDFFFEDVETLMSKDATLSEQALASFFLLNKPSKLVDKVHDGVKWTRKVDKNNKGINKANPEKVVNALSSFKSRKMTFGNQQFLLDKKGIKHILERHHPEYWNGTVKKSQSFLNKNLSVDDLANIVQSVMQQNRTTLINRGTTSSY